VTTDVKTNGTSVVSLEMEATPEEIFAVLADGHAYDDWVVGAKQIRAVDADWPAKGSQSTTRSVSARSTSRTRRR